MISLFHRVENTLWEKEKMLQKNTGEKSAFSPFPKVFSKAIFVSVIKSQGLCGKKLKHP